MEEGRGSLEGTLLTEGKRLPQQQTAHTALPRRPQRNLLTKAAVQQGRVRRKEKEGDPDQRGLKSHGNNCEDKEKAVLTQGQN